MDPAYLHFERLSAKSDTIVYNVRKMKQNGENFLLQNSTNFSPAVTNSRKKKCFSDQEVSQSVESCDFSKNEHSFNLISLPLIPLANICAYLKLIDRQMISKLCSKLKEANEMAWLRRRCLNLKIDVAAYVFHSKNAIPIMDEYFDFVSMRLLFRKLELLTPYFASSRLNMIDFSHPSGSFQMKRFGSIFLLNFDAFHFDSLITPTSVLALNFRRTVVDFTDLETCATIFPKVTSVAVSLRTVVWPDNLSEYSAAPVACRLTSKGECNPVLSVKFQEDNFKVVELASMLRSIFRHLKEIEIYYF